MLVGTPWETQASAKNFEVWLVDQSNSKGLEYGGTIYVYEGSRSTSFSIKATKELRERILTQDEINAKNESVYERAPTILFL